MAPQYHPLLDGAVELHCHSAPSLFARRQTDWELVEEIKAAGMAGALIKSHESSTADRTALIRDREPGLHIYGGLVCNYFTGGLSATAVDAAIRLGAKCIWMPTISSQAHYDRFTGAGTRLFESDEPIEQPGAGLTIIDDEDELLPEVRHIIDLVARADIVLATGHLSPKEVTILTHEAWKRGVSKVLIQHADMGITPVPLDMQIELARKGALIEKCYLACSPDFKDLTVTEMVRTMRQIGYGSCVMVSDHGQAHNPPPVQALSDFIGDVLAEGVTEENVVKMVARTPLQLLNIS